MSSDDTTGGPRLRAALDGIPTYKPARARKSSRCSSGAMPTMPAMAAAAFARMRAEMEFSPATSVTEAMSIASLPPYARAKLGCEPAPLLLGFVLGPLLEEHLRRAMILSRGDPMIFLHRPISAVLLALAALALVVAVLPSVRKKRDEVFVEED